MKNFYLAKMEKFRRMGLEEYSHVIFMDSDVIPLHNLGYLFHRSKAPDASLKENVVLAWRLSPAHGGFFMLRPNRTDYEHLVQVMRRREEEDFDVVKGWGHEIIPPGSLGEWSRKQRDELDILRCHS